MKKYDVIVLGVGAMGSATCYHLARSGANVLGVEQFQLAHDRGSSHGETRMIRKAYFESPDYVPLLKRAYELWEELNEREKVFHETGLVYFCKGDDVLSGVMEASQKHGIEVETWSAAETMKRFPQFQAPDDMKAIWEKSGGFLEVEKSVALHGRLAEESGATLRFGERVQELKEHSDHVEVKTDKATYVAEQLVVTAGAWTPKLLPQLKLTVHRNLLFWFDAPKEFEQSAGFPCFAFDLPYGIYYGFPMINERGFKIAHHFPGEKADPDQLDRTPRASDFEKVIRCLKEHFPRVDRNVKHAATCMYTNTPDENFIVDRISDRMICGAGFSGHGFKFSSVIGEILASLARGKKTSFALEFLGHDRFS